MSDELRRSMATSDEPKQVPLEEWDGIMASKSKYPLTPCMLTPYNTPHCNLNSLKQRLHQSQTNDVSSTSQPQSSAADASHPPSSLPSNWTTLPPPSPLARLAFLGVATCIGAPIVLVLALCSPVIVLFSVATSPVWVPLSAFLWWSSSPPTTPTRVGSPSSASH
ncbi:hypothetical protein H257_06645 [Aphanomyces astaci]|uniref:Uncharacterized protein n=1 Tax=Aphanomyces astaci TaxID=112090 RepID=W4GN54_APHAT|nr:hypothetical protein H257_06645 [Aphanomyces astaci]ETV80333.1 hypothetical protein H257_06645 [Aphanomyces astaci]|eukprot:XP_009830257.1 hypothetical protein H257_06645 [Aphanomyces astaci]